MTMVLTSKLSRTVILCAILCALCAGVIAQSETESSATIGGFQSFNAASFESARPQTIHAGIVALVSGDGAILTSRSAQASGPPPLPTRLAGCSVFINGEAAPLFYVSPGQINAFVNPKFIGYSVFVEIEGDQGQRHSRQVTVEAGPGIFSAAMNGRGVAAGLVTVDGRMFYKIADDAGAPVPLPAPVARDGYLILFGTSFPKDAVVRALIGGREAQVTYAGSCIGFVGLDQINLKLTPELAGRGLVEIEIAANGASVNRTQIKFQ